MGVCIDPIIFLVRSGPKLTKYGDPYDFVCTIIKTNDHECKIIAATGRFTRADYKDLLIMLKGLGFETVIWDRKKIKPKKTTVTV